MMMQIIGFVVAIFLLVEAQKVCGNTGDDIKGRLLAPEEGCGLVKVKNSRILGGSKAPVGAYPWLGVLVYEKGLELVFECGGSLITSKHVLSAAHCMSPKLKFVRLGEHDLRSTVDGEHQDIPVARHVTHESFDPKFKTNDVAIIHLEHDVEFSDKIRPICLPLDEPIRSQEFLHNNAFVAGFGRLFEHGWPAKVLQHLQVPIIGNQRCRSMHLKAGAPDVETMIGEHVICAGGFRCQGFWWGDSGGPLMLPIHQNGSFPFYQIGIVSFSYGCAKENVPGVYSKVQYYADWIKKQLGNSTETAHMLT